MLNLICIAGLLEAIPEDTVLEMREIREGMASSLKKIADNQEKMADNQEKMKDNFEELRVMCQISGLMAWKAMRWTLSTASDGDMRPSNEPFKKTLMAKYFPGVDNADITCMVTGECMIAMILSALACLCFALNIAGRFCLWSCSSLGCSVQLCLQLPMHADLWRRCHSASNTSVL